MGSSSTEVLSRIEPVSGASRASASAVFPSAAASKMLAGSRPATAKARLQNQPFRKHAITGRPHVLFKSAMSLDGKIATVGGQSQWITGEQARAHVHRLRDGGKSQYKV